jgi:hypothetical protein
MPQLESPPQIAWGDVKAVGRVVTRDAADAQPAEFLNKSAFRWPDDTCRHATALRAMQCSCCMEWHMTASPESLPVSSCPAAAVQGARASYTVHGHCHHRSDSAVTTVASTAARPATGCALKLTAQVCPTLAAHPAPLLADTAWAAAAALTVNVSQVSSVFVGASTFVVRPLTSMLPGSVVGLLSHPASANDGATRFLPRRAEPAGPRRLHVVDQQHASRPALPQAPSLAGTLSGHLVLQTSDTYDCSTCNVRASTWPTSCVFYHTAAQQHGARLTHRTFGKSALSYTVTRSA